MPNKIPQAEFIKRLKAQVPELRGFSDDEVMQKMVERRPDIMNQVETPAEVTKRQAGHFVDPKWWENHPNLKALTEGTTGTFPGIGAAAGGILATPETMGIGSVAGLGIGAGAGQSLRDLTNQALGLDTTSPGQRAWNIGKEGAIGAIVPGTIEALTHPINALRGMAGTAADTIEGLLPPWAHRNLLGKWLHPEFLRNVERTGRGEPNILDAGKGTMVKPPWQMRPEVTVPRSEMIPPKTQSELNIRPKPVIPEAESAPLRTPSELNTKPKLDIPRAESKPLKTPSKLNAKPKVNVPASESKPPKTLSEIFEPKKSSAIIQHSPSNPGTLRGSLDGGQTWKYSTDGGENWTMDEPGYA